MKHNITNEYLKNEPETGLNILDYIDGDATTLTNQYNWPILSISPFSVFGILGNLLVCFTIMRDQKLQTKTNYYLFSLAIADLAVCAIVIPLSVIQDFLDVWIFSSVICTMWIFSDILLCTCSIYHLTFVSILRFIAIQFPLNAKQTTSRSKTKLNIFLIWSIAIFISSAVLYLGFSDSQNIIKDKRCYMRNHNFILYGSIIAFVIPLIIMNLMFSLTVRKLRMQMNKLDQTASEPSTSLKIQKKKTLKASRASFERKVLLKPNKTCHNVSRTNADELNGHTFNTHKIKNSCLSEKKYHLRRHASRNTALKSDPIYCPDSYYASKNSRSALLVEKFHRLSGKTTCQTQTSETVKNELKALKVLGIVFIAFIVAWLPLCLINIGSVLYDTTIFNEFLGSFTYLGYISSTFNPIIYTAFNDRFRKNFFEILQCQSNNKPKYKPYIIKCRI